MFDYVIQIAPADGISKETLLERLAVKKNSGDAEFNLPALREPHLIEAGELSHEIPLGMRVQVRKRQNDNTFVDWPWFLVLRSLIADHSPLRLPNGIIFMDAGYRGEVTAVVDNYSCAEFEMCPHTYFQMVVDGMPLRPPYAKVVLVLDLEGTDKKCV